MPVRRGVGQTFPDIPYSPNTVPQASKSEKRISWYFPISMGILCFCHLASLVVRCSSFQQQRQVQHPRLTESFPGPLPGARDSHRKNRASGLPESSQWKTFRCKMQQRTGSAADGCIWSAVCCTAARPTVRDSVPTKRPEEANPQEQRADWRLCTRCVS